MKRAITALSVLCGGMLFVSPINNIIFAQSNNKPKVEMVENVNNSEKEDSNKQEVNKVETNNNIDKTVVTNESNNNIHNEEVKVEDKQEVKKEENNKIDNNENQINKEENNEAVKEENKVNNEDVVDNTQKVEENNTVSNDKVEADTTDKNKVEVVNVLNQEQAKELLQMHNPNANYAYQGDENNFSSLKDKGLSGYVFLPDYDTDLGFFVNKNTSDIYYFHPSGYLELAM